ncbi:hypothetical protein Y032_0343g3052 [Ancylostoma ceylanicum]|uniref:Uncharacterized protein n=1 Tax=Ancylostoma ceylanicum TaxID=53326 RepID=A0A016RXL9_9BILA|nr:hypothetical protein Y032_0343g3052 [Ancylostoma ceylanicum]
MGDSDAIGALYGVDDSWSVAYGRRWGDEEEKAETRGEGGAERSAGRSTRVVNGEELAPMGVERKWFNFTLYERS